MSYRTPGPMRRLAGDPFRETKRGRGRPLAASVLRLGGAATSSAAMKLQYRRVRMGNPARQATRQGDEDSRICVEFERLTGNSFSISKKIGDCGRQIMVQCPNCSMNLDGV